MRMVGEMAGVARLAAAARQADVHVDQRVLEPGAAAASMVSVRVDGDGDHARPAAAIADRRAGSTTSLASSRSSPRPAADHADDLSRCRAGEGAVAVRALARASDVHLWAFTCGRSRAGERRRHRRQVVFERVGVDQQRRCRQSEMFITIGPSRVRTRRSSPNSSAWSRDIVDLVERPSTDLEGPVAGGSSRQPR